MIKNIIYDFGGVLFNLSFKATEDAFKALGYDNFNELYNQYKASPLFDDLERGKIGAEEFYAALRNANPNPVTDEQLRDAWNAMLLGFRKESFAYLKELKKDYNIFLLSNTNIIHHQLFEPLSKEELDDPFESYFNKVWLSHEIGYRKPNLDIFEFVTFDGSLVAEETLFIEDTAPNLEPAKAFGIKTHLLLPGEKIEDIDYSKF